jgi:tRNA(adenine34) deaminase
MSHSFYMGIALKEAKKALGLGEVPIGAVIVHKDELIAKGHNLKETLQDPTAHAEIVVIKEAAKRLKSWRLDDCILYVTLEPCPMCAGAIVQARIPTLVYGATDLKAGAVESVVNLVQHKLLNHQVSVYAGIREDECKKILRDFFQLKRNT